MHYIGIVHQEAHSDWGITFPDLPGCISAAASFAELPAQAAEALSLHLEGLLEDGDAILQPSDLAAIRAHPDAADAISFIPVQVPDPGPALRVNITLPAFLLRRIDAVAAARGQSRSGLLAQAAQRELADSP